VGRGGLDAMWLRIGASEGCFFWGGSIRGGEFLDSQVTVSSSRRTVFHIVS
jgi:hypothetical protein